MVDTQLSTVTAKPEIEKEQKTTVGGGEDTLWKVVAHDDPVTTMDFVVRLMVQVFKKPLILAEAIMWQVHNEGQSVVVVLPKAEAEQRVRMGTLLARMEGFPFRLTIEPA